MTIDEIIEKKPHLKETLELYKKVREFKKKLGIEVAGDPSHHDVLPSAVQETEKIIKAFSDIFSIALEDLLPFREPLESLAYELKRPSLKELPAWDVPYRDEELEAMLFLLSKPYLVAGGRERNLYGKEWIEGKCPLCDATPSVSLISKEERRSFFCSFCETVGRWNRVGCPNCLSESFDDISIIIGQDEEGMRVDACERCSSYYKSFESFLHDGYDPEMLDLISMPLDVIAQEEGFRRRSPNPIGVTRIS